MMLFSGMMLLPASAGPIIYSISAYASGTLGGTPFTNALVTVTLTGNTANVVPGPAPYTDTVANTGTAIVNVPGIGSAVFTEPTGIVDTLTDNVLGAPVVLIERLDQSGGTGILLQTGTPFLTYGLTTALGPVSGSGGAASGSHMTPHFATTAGDFTWAVGQSLTASTFTATLLSAQSIQGGMAASPTFLSTGSLGQVSGNIGGGISQDFYSFYWGGGFFSVSASTTGALSSDIFTLSEGSVGNCTNGASGQLNSADSFSATISANLAPGTYCVGLSTTNASDPTGTLTFNTALNTTPEPGTFVLAFAGIAALAVRRLKRVR